MKHEANTPLIRLAKRDAMSGGAIWAIRVGSIVLSLLIGCLVILITGNNPFKAYGVMIQGSLGGKVYLQQTIKIAIPLLGCALAIAPCFKMRFWNIGAEGQITAGALGATLIARLLDGKLPSLPLLLLMCLAAIVAGGIWGLIPAFFKAKWNSNETLFTLMMNYIIIGVVGWLQNGPWEARQGRMAQFSKDATLPKVLGIHCGWIIVLVLVLLMFFYMRYTKQGFEIAVIGDSKNTASYAGMKVGYVMMRTMFLSGAICGITGFIILSGANGTLASNIANGVGFTAITVAWLSQLNPFAMIVISMMLAILTKGADTLQTQMNVPASLSNIIIGLLLFCMLGCEFFINFKMIFRSRKTEKEVDAK
ncbi:MAG: ABC transporter permease [Oscillospiraceae bacterium]|nr:ABC transporter permease [Oscillospiraceae bacterium]